MFSIRVEPGSVSGTILGQARADILIKDVVETTPSEPDLSAFQHLIDTLVIYEGVSGTAAIITESNTLSTIAQSLEVRGLLANGVWDATGLGAIGGDEGYFLSLNWWPSVLAFVAKSAYKAATGQELFDEISYGEIINNSGAVAPKNMSYSSEQIAYEGNSILKPGDMVDGRLVIHQPWVAFDDNNNTIATRSAQGRYGPEHVLSHHNGGTSQADLEHSFDWTDTEIITGEEMYAVAPFDAEVIFASGNTNNSELSSSFGNVVTIKSLQMYEGKYIYMTFMHLEEDSTFVPLQASLSQQSSLDQSPGTGSIVSTGEIIGSAGTTGGYPEHLHISVGTRLDPRGGLVTIANPGTDVLPDDAPPIYMLGFTPDNVGSNTELGLPTDFQQDYGFPIGEKNGDNYVAGSNNEPLFQSLTYAEFISANPNFGTGGDFPIPDPIWTGTVAAETNAYWEGKVSNINEFINAGDGYDFILASGGNDVIDGQGDGGQVNIIGNGAIRANFEFTQMADGGVQAISLDGSFGTDRYYNIDGVWFDGQGNIPGDWYNLADLLINTQNDGDGIAPTETWQTFNELFSGTDENDFIRGGSGIDWFTATAGNDFIFGGDGQADDSSWNQVNFNTTPFGEMIWGYDSTSDLLFSNHPDLGRDVYDKDITDFWFDADGEWYGRAELIGLATTNFEFV